ncbi:MAG: hypothetical protein K5978_08345 [Campylobacter sp.]|nr:hypothetical protein [Campylobacter sp.]
MKLTFKGSIAIIRPFGFLDISTFDILWPEQLAIIKVKQISCILISLRDVTFVNPSWLISSIDKLDEYFDGNINIGICDYNMALHDIILKKSAAFLYFSLFETEKVAEIMLGDKFYYVGKVGVKCEKIEQRNTLVKWLKQRGYDVTIVDYNDKNSKYDFPIVTHKTHLFFKSQKIQIFKLKNSIFYRTKNIIDSDFTKNFDMEHFENFLRSGFMYFVFWLNITNGLNAIGASFLMKISQLCRMYGASFSLCGINKNQISENLAQVFSDADIFLYSNFEDFLKNNSTVYRKEISRIKPRNINKQVIDLLPSVMTNVIDILKPIYSKNIACTNTRLGLCDIDLCKELTYGVASFYGDFEMRLLIGIKQKYLADIDQIFGDENSDTDLVSFERVFSIITDKILYFLISRAINTKITMLKVSQKEIFFDTISRGALIDIKAQDEKIGIMFISK